MMEDDDGWWWWIMDVDVQMHDSSLSITCITKAFIQMSPFPTSSNHPTTTATIIINKCKDGDTYLPGLTICMYALGNMLRIARSWAIVDIDTWSGHTCIHVSHQRILAITSSYISKKRADWLIDWWWLTDLVVCAISLLSRLCIHTPLPLLTCLCVCMHE